MEKDFSLRRPTVTIKSYMIVFLVVLAAAAMLIINSYVFGIQLVFAPVLAMLLDAIINAVKIKKITLPSSGLITGLLIALILPPSELYIQAAAVVAAILSKHIIRIHGKHVFNPAGFGIVLVGFAAGVTASWWASTTLLVIPLGLFLIWKLRKFVLALSFLIVYHIISAAQAYQSITNATVLDTTAIFFAFFMLIEPLTSAIPRRAQLAEGILVGVLVFAVNASLPRVDLFLLALLIANIFVPIFNKKLRSRTGQPAAQSSNQNKVNPSA